MKFIKNGIIYEPHSDFVANQMLKGGFLVYEETKEKCVISEEKPLKNVEVTEEKPKDTKDKKKKK